MGFKGCVSWQATVQIEWSIAHGQLFPLSSFCSTQISKYCFLRLPELSQLLFCIWNRRPRVFGSVSHFNSFHDDNGTILSSLLYKPANVDYLRRWPHETSTIVIIRFCIHSWQRNPFLDRSHRCQCLANFGLRGRSDLSGEIVSPSCFGRPCFLVEPLGLHSVALMVQRLSDSRAMWLAHLCFAFLVALISLVGSRCFAFDLESIMRSILRCATANLNVHTTLKGF